MDLFFDTKNTFRLCLKFLRQQATVSVVCNGLAKSLCPIFTFSYYLPFYKPQSQKTLQTPLTAVLANALAVSSFLGKFPLNIGTSVGFCFLMGRKTQAGYAENANGNRRQISVVYNGLTTSLLFPRFTFSYYLPFYKPQS